QLIDDWPPAEEKLTRMGLQLVAAATPPLDPRLHQFPIAQLVETPPPKPRLRTGSRTADFRARKDPDRSLRDAQNRQLGAAGELAVVAREQEWLRANNRKDHAERVRHVAAVEGDGAGY